MSEDNRTLQASDGPERGDAWAADPSIYLLADHLDTILACGEDMMALPATRDARVERAGQETGLADGALGEPGNAALTLELDALRDQVEDVRALEARLLAHTLAARTVAVRLGRSAPHFKLVVDLFIAGTTGLVELAQEFADSSEIDFQTADTVTAYLRSRGLIPSEAPSWQPAAGLCIGEEFLVAGLVPLGVMLDQAATFLDAMEIVHDLYEEPTLDGLEHIGASASQAAKVASAG